MPAYRPAAERFWEKVNHGDTCWLWTAALDPEGYGYFRAEDGRRVPAHRWAYESVVGPIPNGLQIDHLCRVRNCVNPAHLEPVTGRENTHRGGNTVKTHCKHGHEFTPENTYLRPNGKRTCRTCNRESVARLKERKMGAQA